MKSTVLEKTKYILTNSWLGMLLPAGVHHLLQYADKGNSVTSEKTTVAPHRLHPAECRTMRNTVSKAKP